MMKAYRTALLFAALVSAPLSQADVQWIDRAVAIVDNDAVLQSELDTRMDMVMDNIQKSGSQAPPREALREQVLDQLILESLQVQLAKRYGVVPTDEQVNQAIARIAANNKMAPAQFAAVLAEEGTSLTEFKQEIRRDITIQQIQQGLVQRNIKISEGEVDNFLNSEQGKFWAAPDLKLGHILIPVTQASSSAERQQQEQLARDLVSQLRKGADFRNLAIAHSRGQNALEGGDLGWRKPAQLPGVFSQAVTHLKVGEISEPLRTGAGFHILKVYEKRGGSEKTIQQSKVRHILLETNVLRDDAEARQQLLELRRQVLNGADFAALAKEHSNDIGSALQGGDLGWSMPGMFVPEFEAAIKETRPGQMSQPFKSPFGWHLLLVEERRNQDFTEEFIRNQARNLLGERKYEEELQNWLQKLRDEAYIEIKLDE